ncbi:glycosyltransferase family 49 protein [Macrolepiota fuliginosa MF-IS2]|uniref:Glycosyltransferase family 49 protein n=1 Tax=Macrolepiota fuliginosa MF-IS2 TaxID=1400762 RepID=A0A9P6C2Z1_9AGAR|nr:glycosyltransferase family 49 protein [Macrolepiota fuliginosa MF-IS2]
MILRHIQRLTHILAAIYVVLSVLFTTSTLLSSSSTAESPPRSRWPWSFVSVNFTTLQLSGPQTQLILQSPYLGHHAIDESIILSKAFPHLMKPSQIIPYYYRAEGNFDREDITITSLVTSNRFEILARLVERYQGPISVTLHINNATENVSYLLDSLHRLYATTENMAKYVDVHLVLDTFDRQFNTWRNIARLFARTDYVMMLDVDFYLCTDFREAVRRRWNKDVWKMLSSGRAAFVVPAFEYIRYEEGREFRAFPRTKKHLMQLVRDRRLAMFHEGWPAGHNSTDYERYYAARPGEVYKVTQFQSSYEPYTIFRKDGPPWCDERFIGYGGNKAACLFEMWLSGMSFYVLSDHFIIHQNHLYEEDARKNERRFNRKIYAEFKEEACLRYLRNFHELGILKTPRAKNAIEECGKMKGIPRLITQVRDVSSFRPRC